MWTVIESTGRTVSWIGGYMESEAEAHAQVEAFRRNEQREVERTAAIDSLPDEWVIARTVELDTYRDSLHVVEASAEQEAIDQSGTLERQLCAAQFALVEAEIATRTARGLRDDAILHMKSGGVSAYRIAKLTGLSEMQVGRIIKNVS